MFYVWKNSDVECIHVKQWERGRQEAFYERTQVFQVCKWSRMVQKRTVH